MMAEIPHRILESMKRDCIEVKIGYTGKWDVSWRDEDSAWAFIAGDDLQALLDRLANILRAES